VVTRSRVAQQGRQQGIPEDPVAETRSHAAEAGFLWRSAAGSRQVVGYQGAPLLTLSQVLLEVAQRGYAARLWLTHLHAAPRDS